MDDTRRALAAAESTQDLSSDGLSIVRCVTNESRQCKKSLAEMMKRLEALNSEILDGREAIATLIQHGLGLLLHLSLCAVFMFSFYTIVSVVRV